MGVLDKDYSALTPEEKKLRLYLEQKRTLEDLRARNAITQEQFEKSFHDMTEKMGMQLHSTD